MSETPSPDRVPALRALLEQTPKHLLWRLAEAFQEYRRGFDADDQYVKWADIEAVLASLDAPAPETSTETSRYCVNHREQTHLAKDACPACLFNQARMMARAADTEKAEAKYWRELTEEAEAKLREADGLRSTTSTIREDK